MNKFESITKPMMWLMALLLSVFMVGCGGGTSGSAPASPPGSPLGVSTAKSVTAFSFAGATGIITGSASPYAIAVTVPSGTNVTALVGTFTTTGTSVKAGTPAVAQVSGTTANDFTAPVVYTVTAADGSTATYTVTVTVAAATAKAISAYSFAAYPGATGTITGAGSPYAIALTVPSGTPVTALVATFTTTGASVAVGVAPQVSGTTANDFTAPVVYTVTAGDASTATYTVTVTAALGLPLNPTAPTLGEAGRFVILASQRITNVPTSAISNGDLGIMDQARSYYAGFTSGASAGQFTELTGGLSYASNDLCPAPYACPLHFSTPVVGATWTNAGTMITQVRTDLGIANTFLAADPNPGAPTQVCPTELGGLTLTRGVYKTASSVTIQTGTLTLDAQGDPNSVWIFSIAGNLTTGAPGGNIVLMNGALAKNVYFRTGGFTAIGAGTLFKGDVFAWTQVNVLAGANITGSLFAATDQVTLISDIVTKAP